MGKGVAEVDERSNEDQEVKNNTSPVAECHNCHKEGQPLRYIYAYPLIWGNG